MEIVQWPVHLDRRDGLTRKKSGRENLCSRILEINSLLSDRTRHLIGLHSCKPGLYRTPSHDARKSSRHNEVRGHEHATPIRGAGVPTAPCGRFSKLESCWSHGATRTRKWPMLPTLREIGIDMGVASPYGLAEPKGMEWAKSLFLRLWTSLIRWLGI